MEVLLQTFEQTWVARALIASIMVGISCGILGCFMVLRNMALIGDALSHAVLPGIFVAFVVMGNVAIGFLTGSLLAALIATLLITWIQENVKTKNDAVIGIIFTFMFSLGVIGISYLNTREGVHLDLKDFLFGSIMGVSDEDLLIGAGVMIYTIFSILILYRYLLVSTFQPTIAITMGINVKIVHYFLMALLSLTVVISLRIVGIILVVAMLVTPASAALLLTDRLGKVLLYAAIIGIISAVIGLVLAILLETTPGPMMCVVASSIYGLTVLFAPSKGLFSKRWRRWQQQISVQREDIIKYLSKIPIGGSSTSSIAEHLNIGQGQIKKRIKELQYDGFINQDESLTLSVKGINLANKLVKAHRLWETFLVDTVGLDNQEIHDDAEKHEHLLDHKMIEQLDARLGHPSIDPHGSPIPSIPDFNADALIHLRPHDRARICERQLSDLVESKLWEQNLPPNAHFQVIAIDQNGVTIRTEDNQLHKLDAELAGRILIATA